MKLPSDQELRRLEDEYKAKRGPDSVSYLVRLRPTILRFYLDGYSRQATYDFLKTQALISCSRTSFYKWLDDNMDLPREAQAYAEAEQRAAEDAMTKSLLGNKDRMPETAPTKAAVPRQPVAQQKPEAAAAEGKGGESQIATFITPFMPTSKIESDQVTDPPDAKRERERKLAILDSTLSGMEARDMGAVAERARAKLAERDSSRGKDG